jgi:hypothetical protein
MIGQTIAHYRVSAKLGARGLMIQSPDGRLGASRFEFDFVFNWFEELKRLAPPGK